MITIHKFEVSTDFVVELHKGYEILTAKDQQGTIQMWVKFDTKQPKEQVRFVSYGTGHEVDPDLCLKYVSTFEAVGGMFVFHLFEVLEEK